MILWKAWMCGMVAVASASSSADAAEDSPPDLAGEYLIGTGIYDM
jgi:hypothetical protein